MKQLLRQNAFFLIPYAILFLFAGVVLLMTNKAELHLWLNSHHTTFWDSFFKTMTKTGEAFPYIIGVIVLFFSLGKGTFIILGQLTAGLCTQILKHIFNEPRPLRYFADNLPDITLPLVEGVTVRSWFSFPSGHTTAMFAFFFSCAVLLKNPTAKICALLLATLGGLSRIYLSQHFAEDVWMGSIIGTSVILSYAAPRFPLRMPWSDRTLQSLFQRKKA